jgi:hypothetical protein|tara:strand:- start:971 stop:1372 length:402 start_codon:yes stop_codon:yes gene_type:complete
MNFRYTAAFLSCCFFLPASISFDAHAGEQNRLVVVTANGDEFYFLPPTLKRSGDEVTVEVLMNYGHPDPFNNACSSIQVTRFDCEKGKFQIMSDKFFSKKMGKGRIVQAADWPMPAFPTPKGSAWQMVQKLVC